MANLSVAANLHPMNRIELRTRAFNLIKEKSFSRGQFRLASGKMSDYYLDLKPTMSDPDGANALAVLIMDRLEGMETDIDLVGGLELGAVPLISSVTLLSSIKNWPLPNFIVRKNVKDHGTKRLIEGTVDLSGKTVVILDDVTTTGESAMIAVRAAQEAGATVALVLSVVDRQEGATEYYERHGVPFAPLFTAEEFLRASQPSAANGP